MPELVPIPDPSGAPSQAVLVGWKERVSLPNWGIKGLIAKIDTGAKTSSIHVESIQFRDDDQVRFEVVVREDQPRKTVWVQTPLVRETVVKPSSGERQTRPVVKTLLRLAGQTHEIEATLVGRRGMRCRMLVGRAALDGRYVVDPSRAHIHRRRVPGQGPPSTSPELKP